MLNAANLIIDFESMKSDFTQMRHAIEVVVNASLANTANIINQIMVQTNEECLHLKTDDVEVVAAKDKIMILTKNIKLVSNLENFEGMDYTLNFSLHKQAELLNAVLKLGCMLESGKLNVDTDFHSDGLALASLVLNNLNNNAKQYNVLFNGCKICVKSNEAVVNNKVVYQNGVLYFDKYYCGVLADLFSKMK